MYVCMYVRMYIFMYVCMYVCTHTHTHFPYFSIYLFIYLFNLYFIYSPCVCVCKTKQWLFGLLRCDIYFEVSTNSDRDNSLTEKI